MFELKYEIEGIDAKTFYGVNNQYFNLLKSKFPTLKITGRDHFILSLGPREVLDILKLKLDDVVSFISENNSYRLFNIRSVPSDPPNKSESLM